MGPFARIGHDDSLNITHDRCDVGAGVGDECGTESLDAIRQAGFLGSRECVSAGVYVEGQQGPSARDDVGQFGNL